MPARCISTTSPWCPEPCPGSEPNSSRAAASKTPCRRTGPPAAPVAGSFADPSVRRSGRSSLRLVASSQATTAESSLRQTLTAPLVPGGTYTLSFWYLPHASGGDITLRLNGGGLFLTVSGLEPAVDPATPGRPSSMRANVAAFPDLWINELLPSDLSVDRPGWVELHNGGASSVT
jgi:hypothetical protein